ncbi:hypothetical protein FOZ62_000583, partial [Perkinsus olseni]
MPGTMSRQIVFMRFLNIAASLASSWALRGRLPDVQTRHTMTLNNDAKTTKTVVGYLETPGDVPPRVIDVAHFEFPDGKRDYFKFAFVADEDALKRFSNPLIEMLNASEATPRSPPSLKEHLMHNLGSEILEGYEEKFNHNKELYCMLQSTPSRGPIFARFTTHLSRAKPGDAFVLRAMKAEPCVYHERLAWSVDPKFYADRLTELLSGSEKAIPLEGESAKMTCERQLRFYSEYISPPEGPILPDT